MIPLAYIKLTSKLRRMMEEVELRMRASGYAPDLRWIEKGICPLCDKVGGRPGTISTVGAPQANMSHIPYSICETCVSARFNIEAGGFGPEALEKIESTMFGALGINPDENFMRKLPKGFADQVTWLISQIKEIPVNPIWLQYYASQCPGCGQEMEEPGKVGMSVTTAYRGLPVAVPYLLCSSCAKYTDEQLSPLVQDRILAAIAMPITGGPTR